MVEYSRQDSKLYLNLLHEQIALVNVYVRIFICSVFCQKNKGGTDCFLLQVVVVTK